MTPREEHLAAEVDRLRAENRLLKENVDLLVRRVFGRSSVKGAAGHPELPGMGGAEGGDPGLPGRDSGRC